MHEENGVFRSIDGEKRTIRALLTTAHGKRPVWPPRPVVPRPELPS
jgi:hypothetical protein